MSMVSMSADAATYTLYDSANLGEWTGGADGYIEEVTVDGKQFTIETVKANSSTGMRNPATDKHIRLYGGADLVISSTDLTFTTVTLTFNSNYSKQMSAAGWTGKLESLTYTATNAEGANTIIITNTEAGQARIASISVSDDPVEETPVDPDPIVPDPVTEGDGTIDNPYTIADVMASTTDANNVWVIGYVAGYVSGMSWDTAVFSADPTEDSTNYTNGTNMILSSVPVTESSAVNSVPVGLNTGVRNVLGISKNPEIYGAKVKVKGNLTKYFGQRGVKSVSEYVILDDQNTPGESTVLTVFDINTPGTWASNADGGFTSEVTVDGHTFTLESAKGSSQSDLLKPGEGSAESWRIYKNSQFSITASDYTMHTIVITYATDKKGELQLPAGWVGTLDDVTYTLVSTEGASSVTFVANTAQVRIKSITVSDAIEEEPVIPELPSMTSVAETITNLTNTRIKVDYDLTVAFRNNKNVFAVDANGDFIQVYGDNNYQINDVIPAGWDANYVLFNTNTPELTPVSVFPESTTQSVFVPETISDPSVLTTANVNEVVMLKDVVFSEDTPASKDNFTGMMGETGVALRNNYVLDSVEAGKYDVEVVCTIFNNAVSLYVISYTKVTSTGVEEIEGAQEAVYFNLHGNKVANPENGIFIKVCGDKAEKVVIR